MAPPSSPRLLPTLADDTISEIFLRLPPDEPACLVRATLLSKPWRRRLLEATFLHKYRTFHGAPPLLGFHQEERFPGDQIRRFIPTTATSPLSQPSFSDDSWAALDCRHGRVLIDTMYSDEMIVWNPITGIQHHLPPEPGEPCNHLTVAVLCAVDGCDHLNCHEGPFRVVFGAIADEEVVEESLTWVSVYSSETGAWTEPTSIHLGPVRESNKMMGPSLLIDDALYFILEDGHRILKYDLGGDALTVISNLPPLHAGNMFLVKADDGALGVASVDDYSLHLWSWRTCTDGVAGWVKGRVIELEMMISVGIGDPTTRVQVVGFAEVANVVFISANNAGIFTVGLKSGLIRKVSEVANFQFIFPYESFYIPDHWLTEVAVLLMLGMTYWK
ncbi:hypothetical protein ACP70R_014582 [Stipagrostis hirtigluma subsp. patula]